MKKQNDHIYPIWKNVGESTHRIAKRLATELRVKTSHTGTLDPMAEGVVIILAGEERHKKYEYAHWLKTYEFQICFGIQTDTFDSLGKLTAVNLDKKLTEKELKKVVEGFKGNYKQKVPPYSAIKIKGKPLHWWARNNKLEEIELPLREGEIKSIKLISLEEKSLKSATEEFISDIEKTSGDLRQEEIIEQWRSVQDGPLKIARIQVELTKGLYVRQLSQDICEKLNCIGITNKIVRTKNGKYEKNKAHMLNQPIG